MSVTKETSGRLSREEWLRRALDVLAAKGPGTLNIKHLVVDLGVSRGSFYWHFTDRAEFVRALLNYWHDKYTAPVPELIDSGGGSGKEKFVRFLHAIHNDDLTRFDIPIRSWAMQEPEIARLLMRTDNYRLDYVKSLFLEMGFSQKQAEIRARSCVAYLTMDKHLMDSTGAIADTEDLEELCAFFTGNLE